MARKVIGVGETILDIIFRGNQPHAAVPGGSTFNGMVSLSRLGVPVTFVGEVGNDRVGDIACNFMRENGMTTDYVSRYANGKSPVSLAFLNEHRNAEYMFYTGYPANRSEIACPEINEDDIFVFGSFYALDPTLHDRMVELLEFARRRKAIIYYDPNFRKMHLHEAIRVRSTVMDNYEYATLVRGSDEDFFNLYGQTDMDRVYHDEIRFYCKTLITTHGANGVNLYTEKFRTRFDVPEITPVSTVGAGDNFNAGVIYGLIKYNVKLKDLSELDEAIWTKIIRQATEFASAVCQSYDNYISTGFADAVNKS